MRQLVPVLEYSYCENFFSFVRINLVATCGPCLVLLLCPSEKFDCLALTPFRE